MKMFILQVLNDVNLAPWGVYGVIPSKYRFKVSNKVTRVTYIGHYPSNFW